MNEPHDPRVLAGPARHASWVKRVLLTAVAAALAVTAFFFLMLAIAAAALVALGIGIRFWWILRKLRKQERASAALEGEYTVVERADTARRLER